MKELTHKLKEKSVGADASVRPFFKKTPKENKGITLIALIITIIVMLILVGVTVSFTIGENGIINQAKTSKNEHEKAGEKDILAIEAIACYDYQTQEVDGEKLKNSTALSDWELTGINIIVCQSPKGNTYKVEKDGTVSEVTPLEKYVLGDKLQGKKLTQIVTMTSDGQIVLIDDETTDVNEAEYGAEFVNIAKYDDREFGYVKHDNKIYKSEIIGINDFENTTVNGQAGLELIYDIEEETKIGKYVKYKEKDYMIIYDNAKAGIQMVSLDLQTLSDGSKISLEYGIDWESETVKKEANIFEDGEIISDLEKRIYAYNHGIEVLNKACVDIVGKDEDIIKDVRCVGSNPINPTIQNKKWYKSDFLEENPQTDATYKPGTVNGKIYGPDENWEKDYDRMELLGISKAEKNYWLASKTIGMDYNFTYGDKIHMGLKYFNNEDQRVMRYADGGFTVYNHNININTSLSYNFVRSVIILQSDVLDNATGDGSQLNPYVL